MSPVCRPIRALFLDYLRGGYQLHAAWVDDTGTTYEALEVWAILYRVQVEEPDLWKFLDIWMNHTTISNISIAALLNRDPSTLKRKLDQVVDLILHYLYTYK